MNRNVTEINKDTFWTLIDQAREQYVQDADKFTQWLIDRLIEMGPEQAMNFDYVASAYHMAAYKYGLWCAASIILDGCSDDGFIDFRSWLIAQGRDVYMAALKDPDSLADVTVHRDSYFDSLCNAGDLAYEKITGRNTYQDFDCAVSQTWLEKILPDIVYDDGIEYPYTWSETIEYLPKLCAKYYTPAELALLICQQDDTWNITSPDIQKARATFKKSKKIKQCQGSEK